MKKLFLFFSLSALVLSCDKDKFETKPTLEVVGQSSDYVPYGSGFRVNLEFTDKEGDVNDSLIMVRYRMNLRNPFIANPVKFKIPKYPSITKAEFEVNMDYFTVLTSAIDKIKIPGSVPDQYEPDTMQIKFIVSDAKGNKSDTAIAHVIVER